MIFYRNHFTFDILLTVVKMMQLTLNNAFIAFHQKYDGLQIYRKIQKERNLLYEASTPNIQYQVKYVQIFAHWTNKSKQKQIKDYKCMLICSLYGFNLYSYWYCTDMNWCKFIAIENQTRECLAVKVNVHSVVRINVGVSFNRIFFFRELFVFVFMQP